MSVQRFAELAASQPQNELFRFSLARAYLKDNRVEEALPHLRFCVEKKQDWMMPRILLGKALADLGRKKEARPWLEAALVLAIDQHHEDPERELRAILKDL
jgi:predicted Zn-dependent protease